MVNNTVFVESHGRTIELEVLAANLRLEEARTLHTQVHNDAAYPLPYPGYLAEKLTEDRLPAVMINDVCWSGREPDENWVSLWKPLHEVVLEAARVGLCTDASIIHPSVTLGPPIYHALQALDLCTSEFPERPAIIVFHTGDTIRVDTYALLWRFHQPRAVLVPARQDPTTGG